MRIKYKNLDAFDPVAAVAEAPKKLKHKQYGFADRLAATALVEEGMRPEDAAIQLGMSAATVRRITDEECINSVTVANAKKVIAGKFALLTQAVLGAITPEKLSVMSAYQLVGMAGILHQNARLAEGLSTQNLAVRSVATNLNADLAQLRELKQRLLTSLGQGGASPDRQEGQG